MNKVVRGRDGRDGRDGLPGTHGRSAYDMAVEAGYSGSLKLFLEQIVGRDALTDGEGIYESAVANGFTGDYEKLLELLRGPKGDPGEKGDPGDDGRDAYEVAVAEGFKGSRRDWLRSLKGDKGEQGLRGPKGDQGDKGDKGERGPPGYTYAVGGGGGGGGTPTPGGGAVDSVNGQTGVVVLDPGDVGADPAGSAAAAQAAAATDATTKANAAQAAAIAAAATDATTKANAAETNAKSYADTLVVGLLDDRGNYDASGNTFPASGGSGSAGAIKKGDLWTISVAGTLGGTAVTAGDIVRALVDTPGQTAGNWAVSETNIGYTAENAANKDTDGTLAANSDVKYPSQKAVKTYADAKVIDSIADADTTHAPSRNAVFDALALKADASLGNLLSVAINAALTTAPGTAAALTATAPAQITTAQAGVASTLTASAAVAGSSVAGAAAGGAVNITAGNAARLTSGNAAGGDINLVPGTGIGTGANGAVVVPGGTTSAPGVRFSGVTHGVSMVSGLFYLVFTGASAWLFDTNRMLMKSGSRIGWSNSTTDPAATTDTGLGRNGAGIAEVNNGTNGTFRDLKLRNLLAAGGNGSYVQTPTMTVTNLAVAATAGNGARAYVTDSTLAFAGNVGTGVTGGGANHTPVVVVNGAWVIG